MATSVPVFPTVISPEQSAVEDAKLTQSRDIYRARMLADFLTILFGLWITLTMASPLHLEYTSPPIEALVCLSGGFTALLSIAGAYTQRRSPMSIEKTEG